MPTVKPGSAVSVHLGSRAIPNIKSVQKIIESTLGRLGCGGCFSGFDIRFTHVDDFVVNPRTFEVNEQQFG